MFDDFCTSSQEFATLASECPRALLQRFIDVCWSLGYQPELELYTRNEEHWNALPGPVFRCDMLVDTTCEEQCDWERLVNEPYDFRSTEKYTSEAFLRNVSASATGNNVTLVKHVQRSTEGEGEAVEPTADRSGYCTVPGCDQQFPETQRNGWTFVNMTRTRRGWTAAGLCNKHYKSLCAFKK